MTRAARALSLCGLALLVGCGEDRVTPLREEIAKLKKERVPLEQRETAKREADEAEASRGAALARAAEDEAALAAARGELDRSRAALQRETDRNAALRADLDARREPLAAVASGVEGLETRAAERRRRLGVLRDQANALARALRPDDPAWAEKRRLAALTDFERELAAQLPDEPAVRALSVRLAATPPDVVALAASLQALADLLDRDAAGAPAAAAGK
jgi:chromosome segregation ATPase